uniref:Uncharacterized protein n=1 Tax=Biomphalaria glabrata TaxID=6526 RepID=A0A2C9LAS5_BIOGL|nr:CAunnamed protein product [Biomphalaria glabrata]
MMAYQFRKLSQTFRLIPSSKSIGFSTLVEGDQTKNSSLENTSSISSSLSIYQSKPLLNQVEANSNITINDSLALLRSQSESDLQSHLLPPGFPGKSSPVFYKDLVQMFQSHNPEHSLAHDSNFFSRAVKQVGPTSDDILFSLLGHQWSRSSDLYHSREKIAVDILTQPHYQCHLAVKKPTDSLGVRSVVLNNFPVNTDSDMCHDLQTEPACCYCSSGGGTDTPKGQGQSKNGPSPSQLHDIKEHLEELVYKLFKGRHNYNILHENVVMENNLFGDNRTTVGMTAYKLELFKLRLQIKAQFSSTSMEILNVTTLEQTGVIRIHWRLKGLPLTQVLKFWKLVPTKKSMSKEDWEWLEAFSYFHIGKDGRVHKHRIDRMMPDNESETEKLSDKLRGFLNPAKPLVS